MTSHLDINKSGTIDVAHKDSPCPHCGEAFARRQVKVSRMTDEIVHSTCLDAYDTDQRKEQREREQADKETARIEAQAKRDAIRELRGEDVRAWDDAVWKDHARFPEHERELVVIVDRRVSVVKHYPEVKAKFATDVASDPVHALGWSLRFFEQTAEFKIAEQVIEWWQGGLTYDEIIRECKDRALREMGSPTRSTSPTSNLMEQCMGAAWANVTRSL